MQIESRPSRGPYAAALICLLALCLTIPLCWQTREERATGSDHALTATLGDNFVAINRGRGFGSQLLGDDGIGNDGIDTLDELLFQLANRPRRIASDRIASNQPDLFMEYLSPPASLDTDRAAAPQGVIWQYLTATLSSAGRELVDLKPGAQLAPLVARCYSSDGLPQRRANPSSAFSLKLIGPNDRLAMLLPRTQAQVPEAAVDAFPAPWCLPSALVDRLEVLADHPYSADWAQQTIDEVRALTAPERPNPATVVAQLTNLRLLTDQALALANGADDDRLRAELLRAHWGLNRRLECWSLMRDIAVASLTENRFAARVPWVSNTQPLPGQGTQPADLRSLSGDLESYEQSRTPRLARAIVERQQLLVASNDARQRELADRIEQNYRNSNVRLAISAELLERFVPDQQSEMSPVRDRIVGTRVHGQSITSSENKVHLLPDAERWHVNLESDGTVDSDTVADGGQVKVHSLGTTSFTAQKSIVVDRDGVRMGQSTADANTSSQLVGVRSSVDWVPLVNDVVRSHAIDKYRQKRSLAQAQVERKVASRVEQQLDERAAEAVDKVRTRMREKLTAPLESAGVEVTPIDLSTTAQRVIARLRVAGQEQLGGHTPRPRAPADSLASLQLHESALSNAAISLGLDGQRLTAQELQTLMREKFSRSTEPAKTLIDADTVFEFAPQDAVQFRLADQRLELILSLREVDHERNSVRSFRVHAFYVPMIRGLEAEFVRDGALGIEGRIRTGERARMHGVFNKVLSEERKLPLVRLTDPNDQRLAGLMITQMVLEDGWIGLAIGPSSANRTAERTRMLR